MLAKQEEDDAQIAANPNSSKARDANRKRNVVIVDEDDSPKRSSGCCS